MHKLLLTAACLLLTAAVVPAWSAGNGPLPVITVKDGLLTLRVRNMPLREVLQKIASEAQVEIVVKGPIEQPISADLQHTRLEEGLRRITHDFNSVFLYGTQKTGPMEKVLLYAKDIPTSKSNAPPFIFHPSSTAAQ